MKNDDHIAELFRTRLGNAQMNVREGFWSQLQADLPKMQLCTTPDKKCIRLELYKISVAASVLLLLGLSSVTAWYFSQKEDVKQAFMQIQNLKPQPILPVEVNHCSEKGNTNASHLVQTFSCDSAEIIERVENQVTVRISFAMNEQVCDSYNQSDRRFMTVGRKKVNEKLFSDYVESGDTSTLTASSNPSIVESKNKKWAFKASIGSALPKGNFRAPIVAGLSVERNLTEGISLEAGLQYQSLLAKGTQDSWKILAIPAKINVVLFQNTKWTCYASVGGSMEKVLEKSFNEDPLRLSVLAGLGVAYKFNGRFSVFAEPMFSHHFHTDTHIKNLRTERATNMNLLCGVRMTY